jgi:hypothetical protein
VVASDFMAVMRLKQPAPAKLPPAESGGVDAARAWHDAISGRALQHLDVVDRAAAAAAWKKMVDASPPQAGLYTGPRQVRPVSSFASETTSAERTATEVVAPASPEVTPQPEAPVASSESMAPVVAPQPEAQSTAPALIEAAAAAAQAAEALPADAAPTTTAKPKRSWGRR